MAAFPRVTMFFLVSSTWAHTVFQPPCKMYYPLDPLYESNCPDVTAYVCATNDHTYQNECFFCIARWEFGPHIKFDKYGKCP